MNGMSKTYGLSVREGRLMKDDKPYKGVGVNYFNAFARRLANASDRSYLQGFKELASYRIPFVRFMAGGYWPNDNRLYLEDKAGYFALMDDFVKAAEEAGIGLIPSLFWYHSNVPDLAGEPRNSWGDPNSRTIGFMREYIREVVSRYERSPAIWGWEFGNEYNLEQDLPSAPDHRPPVVPHMGTPEQRSDQDDLSSDHVYTALRLFAEEVRKYDNHRMIVSGNSIPRPSQWNQREHGKFEQDTEDQFKIMLGLDNPDPFDVISTHYYLYEGDRFNRPQDMDRSMQLMQEAASERGKPLFIGEFGVSETVEDGRIDHELAKARFTEMVHSLEKADVPLSALWVYDYEPQPTCTVTGRNERAYQLKLLEEWNRRLTEDSSGE
ncbi:cellulase family glycosylhydrolase [Paenibacillus nasutitermitis]|uniref:Glycoside hydrolase family 5 domain-containing protein n=1 Tax=Paenibacillus nasutitermitis TaxID=1652958 RepID=A0A916ZEW0_9BACL|nr:cellulase family glycosylhydrolase [Paenibacillus nasutitermitis]GGD93521.1 hypothetical protein GCM10010911_60220 [Paenibacillus nasutitermitis]